MSELDFSWLQMNRILDSVAGRFFVSPRLSCSRRQQAWLFLLEKQSPLTYTFHINPYQCGCAVCATVFSESEPRVAVARNPILIMHGHYCWNDWCHFWLMYVYPSHFMVKWRFHGELFDSRNWCRSLLMISVRCQHQFQYQNPNLRFLSLCTKDCHVNWQHNPATTSCNKNFKIRFCTANTPFTF